MATTSTPIALPRTAEQRSVFRLSSLRFEMLCVLAVVLAFLVLTICEASRDAPHADEVMDAERAINLLTGRGHVTFTHPQVEPGQPISSVAPAYNYALTAWLWLWGISRVAVVAFNCFIVACVTLLLWAFVYRSSLIRRPALRVATVALLPILPAIDQIYAKNRYDSIGMIALALACFSLTIERSIVRRTAVSICGLLVGTGGLHVAVASVPLALLGTLFTGRKYRTELFCFAAGIALGLAVVFGIMIQMGSINNFRRTLDQNSVASPTSLIAYLIAPLRGGNPSLVVGGNILLLTSLLLGVLSMQFHRQNFTWRHGILFGLLAGLLIPLTLTVAGRYYQAYTWLAAIPMFISAMIGVDHEISSRLVRWTMLLLLGAATLTGFPARAVATFVEWPETDYVRPSEFVAYHVRPDDVVYTTFTGYYPIKQHAREAYFGSAFHSMTADQRASITLAIIAGKYCRGAMFEPSEKEALESFGGDWSTIDYLIVPRGKLRMKIPPAPKRPYAYEITVYRRTAFQE